jgi:thiamine biosynthesis lipoprotein
MKRKLLLYALLTLVSFSSCKKQDSVYTSIVGFAQGSTYNMIVENRGNIYAGELKGKIDSILHRFDMSLSLYVDSSVLSRVNRNDTVTCDSFFINVFNRSTSISKLTGGAFDVTVGPLVKAWGFGPDAHRNISDAKRDSLLRLVGMDKVHIRNGKVCKTDMRISLDFNAIAQGYSVDVICRYFDGMGIHNYLVEIGGEVRARGRKAGRMWNIGIDKPTDNNMTPGKNLEAIIRLSNRSLSTSGNYRKFYIEDGVKYSHEIDPSTGNPIRNNLLSATILADECATADGIATACMVFGKDRTIDFLGHHPEYQGYLIYSDENGNFRTWASKSLLKYISETR